MLTQQNKLKTATEIAEIFESWANHAGAFVNSTGRGNGISVDLASQLGVAVEFEGTLLEASLMRLKIVAITKDDAAKRVSILLKNQVSQAALDRMPVKIGDVAIRYVGHASLDAVPPNVPQNAVNSGSSFYNVGNKFCCGSSITISPVASAGTMGALVRSENGDLFGLTNNHVTGDCNHSKKDMFVLCPAPMDADPSKLPPTAIGRHSRFIRLESGDPNQVARQEFDAAIFEIIDTARVTSMQGDSGIDTPTQTAPLSAGTKVTKVGRTSGQTFGTCLGMVNTPFHVPYQSANFRAVVHFQNVYAVLGRGNSPFSLPGDSGSLVMTEDGQYALGIVFAGGNNVSYIFPILPLLQAFGVTLVTGI